MRCLVSACSHDSSNSPSQEITFYPLPIQPSLREQWLKALGKEDWKTMESSVVCSDHFLPQDVYITKTGLCRLKADAIPVVHVCRICFAPDRKLYSMADYKNLNKAFEMLTGLVTDYEDSCPYLCSECAHRLLNCARFRTKSLRAHLVLVEVVKKHDCITLKTIQSVGGDQCFKSSLSVTHKTDQYDLDIIHVKKEIIDMDDADFGAESTEGLEMRNNNMIELEIFNDTNNHAKKRIPSLHKVTDLDDVKMETVMAKVAVKDNNLVVNRTNNDGTASLNDSHERPVVVYIKAEKDTSMADENSLNDENTSDEDVSLASLRKHQPASVKMEKESITNKDCDNKRASKHGYVTVGK